MHPGPLDRRSRWSVAFASGAILSIGLGRPAWSIDEAATVVRVRAGTEQLLRDLPSDIALAPWYVLALIWTLPSDATWWWRALPLVFAVAGIVVLADLVARVAGRTAALWTVGLLLLLPATVRFAQDARPYSWAAAAVAVGAWCWWRAVVDERRGAGAGVVTAVVIAGLAQPLALPAFAGLLVAAATVRDSRAAIRRTGAWLALGVLLVAPFLVAVARGASGSPGERPLAPVPLLRTTVEAVLTVDRPAGTAATVAGAVLLLIVGALAAVGSIRSWCYGGPGRTFVALLLGWLIAPPVALVAAQALLGIPGAVPRYWSIVVPALAAAAGLGAALIARRAVVAAPLAASLIAAAAAPQVELRGVDGHGGVRWLTMSELIEATDAPGLPVIIDGWTARGLLAHDPALALRLGSAAATDADAVLVVRREDRGWPVGVTRTWPDVVVTCEVGGDELALRSRSGVITDTLGGAAQRLTAAARAEGIACVSGPGSASA